MADEFTDERRSTVREIFLALRERLASLTGLDPSQIFAHLPGQEFPDGVDEKFVALCHGRPRPATGRNDPGAGRVAWRVYRTWTVAVYTREGLLDSAYTADTAAYGAEDAEEGLKYHWSYEDDVLDLTGTYLHEAGADEQTYATRLTFEPVRFLDGGEDMHVPPDRPGWVRSVFHFEVGHNLALTQNTTTGV